MSHDDDTDQYDRTFLFLKPVNVWNIKLILERGFGHNLHALTRFYGIFYTILCY